MDNNRVRLYQVDAFTPDRLFRGNPAGVCLLDAPMSDEWLQNVGSEMNLSETAFLLKREQNSYDLRWFTPTTEVKICGHATLASAHVLLTENLVNRDDVIRFHTKSGELLARPLADNKIELIFPNDPPTDFPAADKPKLVKILASILGVKQDEILDVKTSSIDIVVEIKPELIRTVKPNFKEMCELETRCVVITSQPTPDITRLAGQQVDFVSRVFAPQVGIDEDPVTGSAHCGLTPYWAAKLNKSDLFAYQASKRGGLLGVGITNGGKSVYLRGQAVIFFSTTISTQV